MNTTPHNMLLAENAIDDRTSRAVIDAIRASDAEGLERATPEHCINAAKRHRARVRVVAACLGWLKCTHCDTWIAADAEVDEDPTTCPHLCETDDVAIFGALSIFRVVGGTVNASTTIPRGVFERMKTSTAQPHKAGPTPAAVTER